MSEPEAREIAARIVGETERFHPWTKQTIEWAKKVLADSGYEVRPRDRDT